MGSPQPAAVHVEVAFRLVVPDGPVLPVRACLRYDPADPYAVHVVFQGGPAGEVSWSFARQLLMDGLREPAGMGDVRAWPWQGVDGPVIALALSSPDGHALFELPRGVLSDFVTRTLVAVPFGTEDRHLDLDAAVAALLGTRGSEPR